MTGRCCGLYVNGVQVASKAVSGTIQSSTNPLWIGGNQPYGEYFQGLIDDVRVYNRALTPGRDPNRHGDTARRGFVGYLAAVGADESRRECDEPESGGCVVVGVDGQRGGDGVSGRALSGGRLHDLRAGGDADGNVVRRYRV